MKTLILKRKALALSLTLATVLALAFTQCKKEETPAVTPTDDTTETPANAPILPQGETVHITLKVNQSNDTKLEVNPPHVNFESGDTLYVASDGKYVGYLLYDGNNSEFGGTITGATAGQPLYFYLLGNRGVNGISWTVANEVTTGCSLDISNQFDYFADQPAEKQRPVVSCAPSNENYGETTNFTAILCNQCALVKFNTNVASGTVTLNGMYTQVNVSFADSTITTANTTGDISFATDENGEGWAILLPQPAMTNVTVTSGNVEGTIASLPAINNNDYLSDGITVSLNENPLATPLTFEAKTAGATVTFTKATSLTLNDLEYNVYDGNGWQTYTSGTAITLANIGDKVSFRGNNARYATSTNTNRYSYFSCSDDCYVYGNVMSLIDADDYPTMTVLTNANNYAFCGLFRANTKIYNSHPSKALLLPATTLSQYCYDDMFKDCSKLTNAPELPAMTLADGCYGFMFYNTNLTTAPILPATTLSSSCYSRMFYNCKSLKTAPALPATTLASYCYQYMFFSCDSLTTAPTLPATTLAEYCYSYMFSYCTSLTTVPELPATTLATDCYNYMFQNCTSITTVPETLLPATTLSYGCYNAMFYRCTGLTSAPALPATTLAEWCYTSMFSGCSSLTTAPVLPATTLAEGCYSFMFISCSNLNSVTCLATDISATNCTKNWLKNVKSTGTFTKASTMSSWTIGPDSEGNVSGIPSGWNVVNYTP